MVIFHSYVKLPEGIKVQSSKHGGFGKDRSEPQHGGKQEQNRTKGSTWQWKPSGNRSLFTCVRALPIATLQCLYNRICSHVFLEQP